MGVVFVDKLNYICCYQHSCSYQIFSDMSCLFPYSLYFYHHIEKHDMIMKTQFCSFLLCLDNLL